jgi:hypothetical protein
MRNIVNRGFHSNILLSSLFITRPNLPQVYPQFRSWFNTSAPRMVKTLPFQDIQVPTPGFGAMGLSFGLGSNLSLEEAEPVLLKAIELGCTFWDTAVVYQAGVNEKLLGDFIRKHNVRDKVFSTSLVLDS